MPVIHGIKYFNELRSRAEGLPLGAHRLRVAQRADIIASKRAAGRARDRVVLEILEATLRENDPRRRAALAALRQENGRALADLIRRRLALPVAQRMNFLRVRRPGGGSHL
jgi:hypothetical protein